MASLATFFVVERSACQSGNASGLARGLRLGIYCPNCHPLAKPDLLWRRWVQWEDVPVLPAWLSRLAGRSTVVFSGKSTSSTWSPSSFIAASKRTETAAAARSPFRLRRGFIDSQSAASDFFSV
jgi:hypothetical protein